MLEASIRGSLTSPWDSLRRLLALQLWEQGCSRVRGPVWEPRAQDRLQEVQVLAHPFPLSEQQLVNHASSRPYHPHILIHPKSREEGVQKSAF